MKRRLFNSLLCMVLALFFVDRLGCMLMSQVARHTQDVLGPKLRSLDEGITADVVLMGTSRCHHHYVPSILSDTLGMSVYNAGVGGSDNIFSHYLVLRHVLSHYTPKVICLDVMTSDFAPETAPFLALSYFAPLFGHCEEADSLFMLAGTYWRYKLSHLYRYNAKAASNILGLVMNRQKDAEEGYMPLPKPAQVPLGPIKEKLVTGRDTLKLDYLRRFIGLCRNRRVMLVFVVSPRLTVVEGNQYEALKAIAQENGVPFLDYHGQQLYHNHPEYFKDALHLWDEGARVFSSRFASDLRQLVDHGVGSPDHF